MVPVTVLHQMDYCIVILLSTNVQKLVGVLKMMAKLKIRMTVLAEEAVVLARQDYFANFPLVNVERLFMNRCQSFVFSNPRPVVTASGEEW